MCSSDWSSGVCSSDLAVSPKHEAGTSPKTTWLRAILRSANAGSGGCITWSGLAPLYSMSLVYAISAVDDGDCEVAQSNRVSCARNARGDHHAYPAYRQIGRAHV